MPGSRPDSPARWGSHGPFADRHHSFADPEDPVQLADSERIDEIKGSRNASVLPDPVPATMATLRPARQLWSASLWWT